MPTTPLRITTEDGTDVTEGVQAAYDMIFRTMDWGSGFFSVEDLEPILRLALACGFDTTQLEDYMSQPLVLNDFPTDTPPTPEQLAERERLQAHARRRAEEQITVVRDALKKSALIREQQARLREELNASL